MTNPRFSKRRGVFALKRATRSPIHFSGSTLFADFPADTSPVFSGGSTPGPVGLCRSETLFLNRAALADFLTGLFSAFGYRKKQAETPVPALSQVPPVGIHTQWYAQHDR